MLSRYSYLWCIDQQWWWTFVQNELTADGRLLAICTIGTILSKLDVGACGVHAIQIVAPALNANRSEEDLGLGIIQES